MNAGFSLQCVKQMTSNPESPREIGDGVCKALDDAVIHDVVTTPFSGELGAMNGVLAQRYHHVPVMYLSCTCHVSVK